MKPRNNFLEQLRRRQAAVQSPSEATGKPVDELTDEELDEALNQARRDLLDAAHAELRQRELARAGGQGDATGPSSGRTAFSDVLREANRASRKRRR